MLDKKSIKKQLVIIGFDEIVSNKYIDIINNAIENSILSCYSIIDLKTVKTEISRRIKKLKVPPKNELYISNYNSSDAVVKELNCLFNQIKSKCSDDIVVYIATELKSHLFYLQYCILNKYDCLIEKPIFATFKRGQFYPHKIKTTMNNLLKKSLRCNLNISVMTLARYHPIYNDILIKNLKKNVKKLKTPITSINMNVKGGVWNLHDEYINREDHPYKYGYGMLMHGAYHYIDIFSQLLELNKLLYKNTKLDLYIKNYAAYPFDQNERISKLKEKNFNDIIPNFKQKNMKFHFGETDFVAVFKLVNRETSSIITIGTLSFEQTTVSLRTWKEFPKDVYNKNGRISSVDIGVELSTLYSITTNCYDVPSKEDNIDKIGAEAVVREIKNYKLLDDSVPFSKKTYEGVFHNISNKKVMKNWIEGKENKSRFSSHKNVMSIIGCIGESLYKNGKEMKVEVEFPDEL